MINAPSSSQLETALHATQQRNLTRLAETLSSTLNFADNSRIQAALKTAIKRAEVALLLTYCTFNESCRNFIFSHLNPSHPSLYGKVFQAFKIIKKTKPTAQTWLQALKNILSLEEIPNEDESLALHHALRNKENVDSLIQANQNFYQPNAYGITPLHLACALDELAAIQSMAQHEAKNQPQTYNGLNLAIPDQNGMTPLHYAARFGATQVLAFLLDPKRYAFANKISLSLEDKKKQTPLHLAAMHACPEGLKILLQNPSLKEDRRPLLNRLLSNDKELHLKKFQDQYGMTPLHYAVMHEHKENVLLLLSHKHDLDLVPGDKAITLADPFLQKNLPQKATALYLAIENKSFFLFDALIQTLEDLTQTFNSEGLTAVHLAAAHGEIAVLTHLIKQFGAHAIIYCQDKAQQLAIHHAAKCEQVEVLNLLVNHGASLKAKDKAGNTPLHLACIAGKAQSTRWICEKAQAQKSALEVEQKKIAAYSFPRRQATRWHNDSYRWWHNQALLDINEPNHHGETPYLLVQLNQQASILAILAEFGAEKTHLLDLIRKHIYSEPNQRSTSEYYLAALMEKHSEFILTAQDERGFTVLHHCVLAQQDKMARIFLHPLTQTQRQSLCQLTNQEGLSPFQFAQKIKDVNPQWNEQQQNILNKLQRLFLSYDDSQYQQFSALEKVNFQKQLIQDLQAELASTSSYYYLSQVTLFSRPVAALIVETLATGMPWLGLEAATQELFTGDVYNKLDKALSLVPLPHALKNSASILQNILRGIGFYRHTVSRVVVEAFRLGTSATLLTAYGKDLTFSKNYLKHLYFGGILYYFNEEVVGRQTLSPLLEQHLPSLEALLKQHMHSPTLTQLSESAFQTIHQAFKKQIGVDIKKGWVDAYSWVRENIGRASSTIAEYESHLLNPLLATVVHPDESSKQILERAAKALLNNYYYDETLLFEKISLLNAFLQEGILSAPTLEVLQESGALLNDPQLPAEAATTHLLLNHPFFRLYNLDAAEKQSFSEIIQAKAKEANQAQNPSLLKITFEETLKIHFDRYIEQNITTHFMPLLTLKDEGLLTTLKQIAQEQIKAHIFDPDEGLTERLQQIAAFANEGQLTPTVCQMLQSSLLAQDQTSFNTFIASIILNHSYYQSNFNAQQLQLFKQTLIEKLSAAWLNENSPDYLHMNEAIVSLSQEANLLKISTWVKEDFLPPFAISDRQVATTIEKGLVQVIDQKKHQENFAQMLDDFSQLAAGRAASPQVFSLLYDIYQQAAHPFSFGEFFAKVITNLPIFQRSLTAAALNEVKKTLTTKADAILNDDNPDDATQWYELSQTAFRQLAFTAAGQYLSGPSLITPYISQQANPNRNDTAQYAALFIAGSSGYYIAQYENGQKEYADIHRVIYKYLYDTQGDNKDKQVGRIKTNVDTVNTFFLTHSFTEPFLAGKYLDHETRTVLNRDAREVNAGFIVNIADEFLMDNASLRLDFDTKFQLYRDVIDIYYKSISNNKKENEIHDKVWEALSPLVARDPLFNTQYTLDEATNMIVDAAQRAASFSWAASPSDTIRPIAPKSRSQQIRHGFLEGTKKALSNMPKGDNGAAHVGLGATLNSTGLNLGIMNLQTMEMSSFSVELARGAKAIKSTFVQSDKTKRQISLKQSEVSEEQSTFASNSTLASTSSSLPSNNIPLEPLVHLQTASSPLTFTPFLDKVEKEKAALIANTQQKQTRQPAKKRQSLTTKPKAKTANISPQKKNAPKAKSSASKQKTNKDLTSKDNSKAPMIPSDPIISQLLPPSERNITTPLAMVEDMITGPRITSSRPYPQTQLSKSILDFFIPAAYGFVPGIIIAEEALLLAAGVAVGVSQQLAKEKQEDKPYTFPATRRDDDGTYEGSNPQEQPESLGAVTFPSTPSQGEKTQTLIDQPGAKAERYSFPKTLVFSNYYLRKNENDEVVEKINFLSGPRRDYQHDYQKHQPRKAGGAKWYGASVNPIPNEEEGQALLSTAYSSSKNPNVLFNYYEGKIIKFRHSNNNQWHAYEIEKNVAEDVGDKVLKKFLEDGLITKVEYKKLLKK